MKPIAACILFLCLPSSALWGQLIFAAPAQFGGAAGIGLFQEQNGQVTQIQTGFAEHNFPSKSRDNRFIVFSSPDGVVPGLQVPPSSDIYYFDRATNQTLLAVDHTTLVFSPSEVDSFTPVSAALSPNNQLLAYGVVLTRREGLANPRSTRELNIARASDGLILHNPTFGRGPVSDAFQSEFVGIAWDPGGASFVTPNYVTIATQTGGVVQLPAIVRFAQNQATGVWSRIAVLSIPAYFDGQFPHAARTQIYPVISPSGAGLAYFQLTWPDALGSSQGVVAQIVIANSDGSNARVLTTFNQGFYPAGLAWAPGGNDLVFSIAQQAFIGSGFLPAADPASAVVRSIATSNGAISQIPGVSAGFFPSFGVASSSGPEPEPEPEPEPNPDAATVQMRVEMSEAGQLRLFATGVDPEATYNLQSSTTLDSWGPPQSFAGAELLAGIALPSPTTQRFFRLSP